MPPSPSKELSSINFEAMIGGPLVAVVNAQAQAAMSSVNYIKSVGFKPKFDADGDLVPGAVGDPIYVSFRYPKEVAPYQPRVEPGIIGIELIDGGAGYADDQPVVVTIAPANNGGAGGAKVKVTISGGSITDLSLDDPGEYTEKPDADPEISDPVDQNGTTAEARIIWQEAKEPVPAQYADMKLEVPILTMLPIPFVRIEETTIDFNAKINSVEEAKTDSSFKIDSSLEVKGKYPPLFSVVTAKLKVNTSYQRNTSSGFKVDRTYSMQVHVRASAEEIPAGTERILGILEDSIKSVPIDQGA
jgi:hypothetical protein